MNKGTTFARGAIFRIALVGICAALIEAVKLALSGIPNVEGVTLLCALFGYCFGWYGVLSTVVFVSIEPLIYGYNTWVLSYYLYWPFVAIVFLLLRRAKIKNRFVLTGIAVLLTVWFGVLTSLVDVGLFTGFFKDFWHRFAVYYWRGIWFYVVQIVCNAVVFPLLFRPLSDLLIGLENKFFPNRKKSEKMLDKPDET